MKPQVLVADREDQSLSVREKAAAAEMKILSSLGPDSCGFLSFWRS